MFSEIMSYYLSEFNRLGEPFLKILCSLNVPSQIVLWEYKKLPPIETMNEKDKKELKTYIIQMFPEKTIEEKLNCCKIVYSIGSMIND